MKRWLTEYRKKKESAREVQRDADSDAAQAEWEERKRILREHRRTVGDYYKARFPNGYDSHTGELSSPMKLRALLDCVYLLLDTAPIMGDYSGVFSLIKLLTDQMVLDNAMHVLTENKEKYARQSGGFFVKETSDAQRKQKPEYLFEIVLENQIENKQVEISLATDPVLTFPWKRFRILMQLLHVGMPTIAWREDENNHIAFLLLPVGVCLINSGQHSAFAGLLKRDGVIRMTKKSLKRKSFAHRILDMRPLYKYVWFDGIYYRDVTTNDIVGEAVSFEFGCIFEIGRILDERNICFKKLLD